MKHSFNLLKEYVMQSVKYWNKIQADNNTFIKIKVNEECESLTLWDEKDPEVFCPIGFLCQGVQAMGYSYFYKWNRAGERLVLVIC